MILTTVQKILMTVQKILMNCAEDFNDCAEDFNDCAEDFKDCAEDFNDSAEDFNDSAEDFNDCAEDFNDCAEDSDDCVVPTCKHEISVMKRLSNSRSALGAIRITRVFRDYVITIIHFGFLFLVWPESLCYSIVDETIFRNLEIVRR